jgi:tRNA/rRNA methyltransferase
VFQSELIGIVFGPERTGLLNDHIARCYKAITIPVNSNFPSLNLAQAVSIIGYEWFENFSQIEKEQRVYLGATQQAYQKDLKAFLDSLEKHLDETNFWRVPVKKPVMWRNLTNFFSRIDLTQQDLKTLYGVIDTLRKGRE